MSNNKRPPFAARVNRNHPLAPDFLYARLTSDKQAIEELTRTKLTRSSWTLVADGFSSEAQDASHAQVDTPKQMPRVGSITIYFRGTRDGVTFVQVFDQLFATQTNGAATDEIFVRRSTDVGGEHTLDVYFVGGFDVAYVTQDGMFNGGPHWLTITYDVSQTGTTIRTYLDGVAKGTDTVSVAFEEAGLNTIQLGDSIGGSNTWDHGVYNDFMWHSRILSAEEVARLHSDPFQIFSGRTLFAHTQDYFPPAIEAEAPAGDILTITLVDEAGTPLTGLTGLSWAWFDESAVNSATVPTATGTGATTDGSGVFSVDITGTTLTSGQIGMLALMDSTGYIYALYRITLT